MTSEVESLKTNEFIRRRKLRLQQVREQSKDIAKKIRQRAKVEKLRQVVDLDARKQKEYLQRQGELVKKLEDLYSKGIENVGTSHRSASELKEQDEVRKVDVSKLRGREAAAELRRKKQEKLDEQKKILDRKLQAREAANEISREKAAGSNKLLNKTGDNQDKGTIEEIPKDNEKHSENVEDKDKPITNDMATQWDLNEPEWEPNIPTLALPRDDSAKDNADNRSDKSKRLDLFALSEEMPSSLRGGVTNEERVPVKPSLTMVSEYLQNRALRLRETSVTAKKPSEDLLSIKETILRTRTSRPEVKSNTEKSSKSSAVDSGVTKKNSVTMYNHSTRDTRDVRGDDRLVVRDHPNEDDAYSQARRETIHDNSKHQEHQKKMQDMRHKVAMTKQNIEKEYKDTINFLNSLPKDKGRPIRKAYMDEDRQKKQKDSREQKLQQEYKKIEKECRKHSCTKSRSKSKSPVKITDDDFDNRDFQYSWMPVPESDGSLAIHTIPTTVKEGKSGNTVKFSKVDSYHEYRSRHRHTPPTKDTSDKQAKRVEAVIIEKDSSDITDYSSNASETSSVENIRLPNRDPKDAQAEKERELSDAERIIIYKILDSKSDKKCKKKEKLMQNILKSLNSMDKNRKQKVDNPEFIVEHHENTPKNVENKTFEQINEGVYKTVNEKGNNITSVSTHVMKTQTGEKGVNESEIARKTCHCIDDQQLDMDINLHSKDDISRPSKTCIACKCGCAGPSKSVNLPVTRQSAASVATSISSFKTATNDKASSALPDGGYVKLIDDGGQEAGKFYIGASGLLKDDAYEVVIQLRKKDGVSDKNEEKTLEKEGPTSTSQVSQQVEETVPNVSQENINDNINNLNSTNQEPTPAISTNTVVSPAKPETCIQESEQSPDDVCADVNARVENKQQKVFVDKGVHTSFQMSYAIPSHMPKVDPISRPATSTYTQTTLSSPNHRPVFFHMSSSTSTAYMSPPELVLPQFLKQDYRMTDEEKYDTMQILNRRGYMSEHEFSEGNNSCRCKKCTHAKKIIINKIKPHACCKKHTKYVNKFDTPPNTARSQSSADICLHKAVKTKYGVSSPSVKSHSHKHKNHHFKTDHKSSHSVGVQPSSSAASTYKKTKIYPETRQNCRSDLNPVLKKYVNKLLALNKESLKAIEVADQECSAVTTPGSSIINVTNNINKKMPLENKISFEQVKNILKQQIIQGSNETKYDHSQDRIPSTKKNYPGKKVRVPRIGRKKSVHKVKSLNISKNLRKSKIQISSKCSSGNIPSSSSSTKNDTMPQMSTGSKTDCRSKSSIPAGNKRQHGNVCPTNSSTTPDMAIAGNFTPRENETTTIQNSQQFSENLNKSQRTTMPCYQTTLVTSPSDTDNLILQNLQANLDTPIITASTQTSQNMETEINLIKLAEDKLQNMEKIADLTEKCTKRLSNLAKVLEEVRKNKSLVYSQISTSDTSDSDQKLDKNISRPLAPAHNIRNIDKTSRTPSPMTISTVEDSKERIEATDSTDFVPFLNDIPKPNAFKSTETSNFQNQVFSNKMNSQSYKNLENTITTSRGRPPPALSRISLKNMHDNIIPHELSTVLEVDSLLSVRLTRENKDDVSDDSNKTINGTTKQETSKYHSPERKDSKKDPDLLRSNVSIPIQQTESSNDTKLQVIDINQFNDIMLKPFITFQEHAKKCNIAFDDASNLEDIANNVTEDISSLHSDGSLPDVIAELLKRNVIREPFKFDTASNVNSTTVSSESSLSLLALSKVRKDKKKSSVLFPNKENIGETSDSLSLSSNPDLEIAFKKLGMGWASSTLKKTKERLALSSSTNTSSSSLSQFRLKSFTNQDVPVLVTDSVSSILNVTKKPENRRKVNFNSKNAEQQTALTNSMTVKEFLTNELAKKITFTNKSQRDETAEEFVSLFETKMPEDMKDSVNIAREDHSAESVRSGNNRARTSTPVQIFKSMTYHSSSSSNISNGLFSNADDLSSVKVTSNSNKNHSTSDKDDLTVPNFSLRLKKSLSDCSKSE